LFDEAKRFNLSLNIAENVCWYCVQRSGLGDVAEFEKLSARYESLVKLIS
jgi:hypothetical protein